MRTIPKRRDIPRRRSHSTPGRMAMPITIATKKRNTTPRRRYNSQKAKKTLTTNIVARATWLVVHPVTSLVTSSAVEAGFTVPDEGWIRSGSLNMKIPYHMPYQEQYQGKDLVQGNEENFRNYKNPNIKSAGLNNGTCTHQEHNLFSWHKRYASFRDYR